MQQPLERINVHYEMRGEGRPIIALHGYWTDHRIMLGSMEPIVKDRRGWRCIYPDLPGMGKTPGEKWITNSDHMLEVVCEFIDTLIPKQRFILAGYSYGGYLARGVIHRKREFVDGLLLICPVVLDRGKRDLPSKKILVQDPNLMAKVTPAEKEEFENWVAVQGPRIWERTRDEVNVGSSIADIPFLTKLQEGGYSFTFDVDAEIDQFDKPTLVLTGRQDWIVGYRDMWGIIEKYPRATFAILDRASHNLPIEQEALFNLLVNEWLDRVEEVFE